MPTGVTAGKYIRIYSDGYDVSGSSNKLSASLEFPALDVTNYASSVKENIFGIPAAKASLAAWFSNAANSGSYTLFKSPAMRRLCVAIGIRAAPAVGDPFIGGSFQQLNWTSDMAVGDAVGSKIEFDGFDPTASMTNNIFGVVLKEDSQITVTTNGTAVNNGAATTAGGVAYLHVTLAGGTYAFVVQDSADGSTGWSTIATFTANGMAITSETQAISGTIRQYTRYVGTKTSGNANMFIALVRGF